MDCLKVSTNSVDKKDNFKGIYILSQLIGSKR
jgi:hypothetical protein